MYVPICLSLKIKTHKQYRDLDALHLQVRSENFAGWLTSQIRGIYLCSPLNTARKIQLETGIIIHYLY